MKLEWMGKHRELVEKVIRYGNRYALVYRRPMPITDEVALSSLEVQVLEYLLENEELKLNMAGIARRLGVSGSAFTKCAAKLAGMGLLEKYHRDGNKKDVIVLVSDYGKQVYGAYVQQYTGWIEVVNQMLEGTPEKYISRFARVMDYVSRMNTVDRAAEGEQDLIPL